MYIFTKRAVINAYKQNPFNCRNLSHVDGDWDFSARHCTFTIKNAETIPEIFEKTCMCVNSLLQYHLSVIIILLFFSCQLSIYTNIYALNGQVRSKMFQMF